MTKIIHGIPFFIFLLFIACNNDIFIDNESPSDKELTIPVTGEASFMFQTDNLKSIQIIFHEQKFDCTTYIPTGDKLMEYQNRGSLIIYDKSSSMPYIERTSAENPNVAFDIIRHPKNKLTISFKRNILGRHFNGMIKLEYTYKEENVKFVIESSEKEIPIFKIVGIHYTDNKIDYRFNSKIEFPMTINNTGSETMTQSFCPENQCRMTVHLQLPEINTPQIESYNGMIALPTYNPETRKPEFMGEKLQFKIGNQNLPPLDAALTDGQSFHTEYPVEIPPQSSVRGVLNRYDIFISAWGNLTARNMRNENDVITIPFLIKIVQPVSYNFHWENISLDE